MRNIGNSGQFQKMDTGLPNFSVSQCCFVQVSKKRSEYVLTRCTTAVSLTFIKNAILLIAKEWQTRMELTIWKNLAKWASIFPVSYEYWLTSKYGIRIPIPSFFSQSWWKQQEEGEEFLAAAEAVPANVGKITFSNLKHKTERYAYICLHGEKNQI